MLIVFVFILDILEKPLALRSELLIIARICFVIYMIFCTLDHSFDLTCVLLTVVLMIIAHVLLFLQYTSFTKAIITKHTPVPQQVH